MNKSQIALHRRLASASSNPLTDREGREALLCAIEHHRKGLSLLAADRVRESANEIRQAIMHCGIAAKTASDEALRAAATRLENKIRNLKPVLKSAVPAADENSAWVRGSHQIVDTAMEWFLASGERTQKRLENLVWHWGEQYGYQPNQIAEFAREAWELYKRHAQQNPPRGSASTRSGGSKNNGAHTGWDVYLHGKWINKVFYVAGMTADQVKRGLVEHDEFDPAIVVRKERRGKKTAAQNGAAQRDLVIGFVQDYQVTGKESALSISGNTLYSYAMPIAKRVEGGFIVTNAPSPSMTTSTHINLVIRIINAAKWAKMQRGAVENPRAVHPIIWGFHPAHGNVVLKLERYSMAAMQRRKREGWVCAVYAPGQDPKDLRDRAGKNPCGARRNPGTELRRLDAEFAALERELASLKGIKKGDLGWDEYMKKLYRLRDIAGARLKASGIVIRGAGGKNPEQASSQDLARQIKSLRAEEAVEFQAHGRNFYVRKKGRSDYVLVDRAVKERSRWGTYPKIMQDMNHVLEYGTLPRPSGSMWNPVLSKRLWPLTEGTMRLGDAMKRGRALLDAGVPIRLWDGSGWIVAVWPDDHYSTPSGTGPSGGREYLTAGAGMSKMKPISLTAGKGSGRDRFWRTVRASARANGSKKAVMSFAASLEYRPPHPERTAKRQLRDFDVMFQEWSSRSAMAHSIRMQQNRETRPDDWHAVVPLTTTEGYSSANSGDKWVRLTKMSQKQYFVAAALLANARIPASYTDGWLRVRGSDVAKARKCVVAMNPLTATEAARELRYARSHMKTSARRIGHGDPVGGAWSAGQARGISSTVMQRGPRRADRPALKVMQSAMRLKGGAEDLALQRAAANPVDLSWTDESGLRRIFQWLTKTGIGPKFGSRPIGWYQMHQMGAVKSIEKIAKALGVVGPYKAKVVKGITFVHDAAKRKWISVGTTRDIFDRADRLTRGIGSWENPLTVRESAAELRRVRDASRVVKTHGALKKDRYFVAWHRGYSQGMLETVDRHGPLKARRIARKLMRRVYSKNPLTRQEGAVFLGQARRDVRLAHALQEYDPIRAAAIAGEAIGKADAAGRPFGPASGQTVARLVGRADRTINRSLQQARRGIRTPAHNPAGLNGLMDAKQAQKASRFA